MLVQFSLITPASKRIMILVGFCYLPDIVFCFAQTHHILGEEHNEDLVKLIVDFIKLDVFKKKKPKDTLVLHNLQYQVHKYHQNWTVHYTYSTNKYETPYDDPVYGIAITVPTYTEKFIDYQEEEDFIAEPNIDKIIIKPKKLPEHIKIFSSYTNLDNDDELSQ